MRIAVLQQNTVWEDPEENFRRIRRWLKSAATRDVRLFLLPEMFACGFSMRTDAIAEPPGGRSTEFLLAEAKAHNLWIGGSIPERQAEGELPYNTFLIAGPTGTLLRYQKIHPFSYAQEHVHYAAGKKRVTADIEGLRVTLFVCYDLRFADEFWAEATDTHAYLVVANWPSPRRDHWRVLLRARAIENQAYVVGVNRVGAAPKLEYAGDSAIIDPSGRVLTEATTGETLLLADLDPSEVERTRRDFPVIDDRSSLVNAKIARPAGVGPAK